MSDTVIKNGKKPLPKKPVGQVLTDDAIFGNQLSIPAHIQADLDARGLQAHWIDAQDVYRNGGYHKRGWTPYRTAKTDSGTMSSSEFNYGKDPEGFLRRGSLILGVKSKAQAEQHRALLKQKANRHNNTQKEKAQELRQLARDAGLDSMKIMEGFEENED